MNKKSAIGLGGAALVVIAGIVIVVTDHRPAPRRGIPHHPSIVLPTIGSPFVVGRTFPLRQTLVETVAGHPTHLAQGTRSTVVMAMAPGSAVCAYETQYVLPLLMQSAQRVIDIIDVAPVSGVATAGPVQPAFHGHNAPGDPVTTAGMRAVMQRYVQTYHLSASSSIHVYVATAATRKQWHLRRFPVMAILNPHNHVETVLPGGVTLTETRHLLTPLNKETSPSHSR